MTTSKVGLALVIALCATAMRMQAQQTNPSDEAPRVQEELRKKVDESLHLNALTVLTPNANLSDPSVKSAIIDSMKLSRDANGYLQVNANGGKLSDKIRSVANAALSYGDSIVDYADALKRREDGSAELRRVATARQNLIEAAVAANWRKPD